ncbi:hypothetical protein NM688_g9418 [Phlebia brevispora]|uniref:Uncharacterized protein n=1 Tax=Phlebia brevispora TaxID=194682 RepID=A0ACC1RHD6_9APHY|nr:hypothetical protein NM688_g9418 [Phlebia brevispora]
MHSSAANLSDWSKEHLIAYIRKLEASNQKLLKSRNPPHVQPPHQRPRIQNQKPFDFAKHPRRKIALKFLYDGSHYSGLAAQNDVTPLPTVEEVLWGALTFTRLVDAKGGFEGAGWEKCGRTDAGVSSAGQVVSFWIRSALNSEAEEPLHPTQTLKQMWKSLAVSQATLVHWAIGTNLHPTQISGRLPHLTSKIPTNRN